MRTDDKLEVRVWRGKEEGSFSAYEVPRQDSQTVLDVVTHIQRHLEPSLSYRFACRVGMCGSCAMTVNGIARWTCRTHVAKVADDGNGLEIAPLSNLPVIKDLAPTCASSSTSGRGPRASSRARATRHDDFARVAAGVAGAARPPTPASNASAAASAMPRATSSPGARLPRPGRAQPRLDARQRRARRRSSPSACARSPAMPAATPATRRARAPSAARSRSTPTPAIAGLKRAAAKAAVRGEL